MVQLQDAGMKSGEVYAGIIRLYSRDRKDWVTLEIDANGDVALTNKAGETASIDLS